MVQLTVGPCCQLPRDVTGACHNNPCLPAALQEYPSSTEIHNRQVALALTRGSTMVPAGRRWGWGGWQMQCLGRGAAALSCRQPPLGARRCVSPIAPSHLNYVPSMLLPCRCRCVSMLAKLWHSPSVPDDGPGDPVGTACIGSSEAIMLGGA